MIWARIVLEDLSQLSLWPSMVYELHHALLSLSPAQSPAYPKRVVYVKVIFMQLTTNKTLEKLRFCLVVEGAMMKVGRHVISVAGCIRKLCPSRPC
jgi:hypothetical protein